MTKSLLRMFEIENISLFPQTKGVNDNVDVQMLRLFKFSQQKGAYNLSCSWYKFCYLNTTII